ncbi:MAG: Crp/Fnr family transcriptional regulator [Rhodospirillaceae bacterium]|nr:Crp/Fnr family transcriptional regulator [Rhodospirillaceae bacterium]MBT5456319.1 Crp/Fnr family transcriptional regulator [Rhodospirillaceae bacterium]MBT6885976.1 Crp/Fnr family transcriptional regulator [Rhodospirillaceae bacterium]
MNERRDIDRMELFAGLSLELRAALQNESRVVECDGRTVICQTGTPADCVFSLLSGQIQIYRGSNEKHAVLLVIGAGEVFGLRSVLTTGVFTETAEAVGPCRVLKTPAQTFLGIVERDPHFAGAVAHILSRRLQMISDHFERIQLMPAPQRLADYLMRFAPGNGEAYEVKLPFEKKLIANYLGMEPASFSRAMKKLRDYGLVCEGRRVCVRDPEILKAVCDGLDTDDHKIPSNTPVSLTTRNPM